MISRLRPYLSTVVCVLVAARITHARADGDKATPDEGGDEVDRTAEQLSLADVFAVAVRVAPGLETAAFNADQAKGFYSEARGAFDLSVLMSGDASRTRGAPTSPGLPGTASDTLTGTVTIHKLLPTNGSLDLIGSTVDSRSDFTGAFAKSFTSTIKLRLTQPLLKGFGPAAADRVVAPARHRRNAAVIRRSAAARIFAVNLIQAYWSLALAWRGLEVRRASLELAKKQLTLAEGAVRSGKLAGSELLPIKGAIAGRQQEILTAELDVIDQSLTLRRIAGLEIRADALAVRTAELPKIEPVDLEVAPYVASALAASDELKAAIEEDKASRAQLAGSRRDLLPRADLRVEGGPLGNDVLVRDGTGAITHEPTVPGSFSRLGDGGYTLSANLTVELPINRHGVDGAYQVDHAAAVDAAFQVGNTRADVAASVARSVYQAKTSLLAAQLGAEEVELAEASVDAEQKKFDLGKSSSAEIVRRQDELESARLREAVEVATYHNAIAELDAANGTILAKYGLKIPDR